MQHPISSLKNDKAHSTWWTAALLPREQKGKDKPKRRITLAQGVDGEAFYDRQWWSKTGDIPTLQTTSDGQKSF